MPGRSRCPCDALGANLGSTGAEDKPLGCQWAKPWRSQVKSLKKPPKFQEIQRRGVSNQKKNSCWQPLESLTVTPVRLFASWCRSSAIRYQSHLTLMACFSDGFFSGFCGLFGGLKDHNSLQGISIMETSVLGWDLRGFNVVWRFPML